MVRGHTPDLAWRLMDAQHWASPRLARRQRVFVVADFRITPHIEHEVLYLLNCLTQDPERIVTPQIHRAHSQRLDTLKSELEGLIGQLPVYENRTREVLQEIAAEMYADIDPREYETQRLRRLFQKEVPGSELDANLIAMSISAVLIDGNGNVKIRLKNDQIVERGEQNG